MLHQDAMSLYLLGVALTAACLVVPLVLQSYLHSLPEAPRCPGCSGVTHHVPVPVGLLDLIPLQTVTSVGTCGRCGWSGRMRWKWSPRSLRRHDA